jgi:BetR domain.
MTTGELQQQFFGAVKGKIDRNLNLADEIARLLDISSDSAYRRIRGEITVPLDELHLLCKHYQVSLDKLLGVTSPGIVFLGQYVDKNFKFREYLTSVMNDMAYMNSFKEKEFFYMCKDLPIFHHYHFHEIAAFKWFFWMKTYFEFPEFENKKFNYADHPADLFELEQRILLLYNQLPSVEMWNLESMNIFFRQIEFYRDGEVFESDKDVLILYETIEKLWDHLEEQAALGFKFQYGDPDKKPLGPFRMYFNEVLMGDNNMIVVLDGHKMSYVSHTTINFMRTMDKGFNDNMYNHVQNQMKRSTLISEVSEKERSRFFRIIREKILNRKENLRP